MPVIPQSILVDLVAAAYDPIKPDTFEDGVRFEDAIACLKTVDGTLTISVPGTEDKANVLTDIEIEPFDHPILGKIHSGFWHPVDGLALLLLPYIKDGQNIAVEGHSEGGARASFLVLWFYMHGMAANRIQISCYESPRGHSVRSRAMLERMVIEGMDATSTMNLIDPVVCVPSLYLAPFAEATELGEKPGGLDDLDPVAYHAMSVIQRGVKRVFGQ